MTIPQLGYFLKLAEDLNFTAVANSFFITQPTLSRQIVNLETELNVTLFERSHNNVKLTPEGQHFYNRLKPLYGELIRLFNEVQFFENDPEKISIGLQEEQLISDALMLALDHLKDIYPRVQIRIERCSLPDLYAGLANQRFDLINLLIMPENSPQFQVPTRTIELQKEAQCMAISKKAADGLPDEISAEQFAELINQYSLVLPILNDNSDISHFTSLLFENLHVAVDPEKVSFFGTSRPLSLPAQISLGQNLTISNPSSIMAIDNAIRLIRINGVDPYIKGVICQNNSENKILQKLAELISDAQEHLNENNN